MQVTFWGTRGSIPCAAPEYQVYGGHTSCVEITIGDSRFIFDAGTGIVPLGKSIIQQNIPNVSLLISHLHFDHIIGLPFFAPLWQKNMKFDIYGHNLESFFSKHMCPPLFPVDVLSEAQASVRLHQLMTPETISTTSGTEIKTLALNHPGGATGFRIENAGKSVCYITDTEHVIGQHDQKIIDFVAGTDLLIYDAMYTEYQLRTKIGWGHSTWEEGLYIAKAANVKKYTAFHHNPDHDDHIMAGIDQQLVTAGNGYSVAKQGETLVV
ncbi:MAG: MBL fold metallo-hydrolase [Alphaproteobacteria bacterium]